MSTIITELLKKIGAEGSISIEESTDHKTFSKVTEGVVYGFTLESPAFITDDITSKAILNNCLVYVHEGAFNSENDAQNILRKAHSLGQPLIVIADSFSPKITSVYSKNNANGVVQCALIKANSWGKQRRDLISDLRVVLSSNKIESDGYEYYLLDKVVSDIYMTSFLVAKNEATLELIKSLKIRIGAADIQEKAMLSERLKILSGGIATIYVGANTKSELLEKKDRYEDAILAVKSAIEEGVLPGGGAFHIFANKTLLEDMQDVSPMLLKGYKLFAEALLAPIDTNIGNMGNLAATIDRKKYTAIEGYDLATGNFGDLYTMGIIDATKVTRIAITNALSIAKTVLMTDNIIK